MSSKYLNENVNSLTEKELKAGIQSLAKVANQRLRQLEKSNKATSSPAYKYIERLAFDATKTKGTGADKYSFIGETKWGEIKFNTATTKMNQSQLRQEFSFLQRFLNTKTSTVTGVKKNIEKSYEKFKEQYEKQTGSPISNNVVSLWSDALFKHFSEIYGSDEAENFMQQIDSANLSISEVHEILRKSGFSLNTGYDEIALSTIYDNFDSWVKSGVSDSDGQSIETEDDL